MISFIYGRFFVCGFLKLSDERKGGGGVYIFSGSGSSLPIFSK